MLENDYLEFSKCQQVTEELHQNKTLSTDISISSMSKECESSRVCGPFRL